jgi:transposase
MKPYSKDLRLRVLAAIDSGKPREEVAKTFSVSMTTIKRWLKRRRETGDGETYVEHFLAPSLREGQVVVLDKLGAHRTDRVRELIEGRGADLVFLPSYSPDLNP